MKVAPPCDLSQTAAGNNFAVVARVRRLVSPEGGTALLSVFLGVLIMNRIMTFFLPLPPAGVDNPGIQH